MEDRPGVRQRILQQRPTARAGILLGRHHRLRSGHTDGNQVRRDTTPNLRPPLLVLLNRLPLQLSHPLPSPDLSFTAFVEQLPGIDACDRFAAEVVSQDFDITASEVDTPPTSRHSQTELELNQRNELGRDFHIRGRLSGRGSAEHALSPINQELFVVLAGLAQSGIRTGQKGEHG
jgi:hypothetical protein